MRYTDEYITIEDKSVKQVNKTVAKCLYDKGETVYLNACNMRLDNMWTSPIPLNNKAGEKFNTMVNAYEYYNCDNERGLYANFFVAN